MARVTDHTQVQNCKPEDVPRFVSAALSAIVGQFNGKVDFGDNIRSSLVSVAFLAPSTEVTVIHSLSRIPQGYIVITQDAAGSVLMPLSGATYWTDTQMSLQATAAMDVSLLII